jgi:hypothetical protein
MKTKNGNCVPNSLAFRQKFILVFQKIDGIDVSVFSLIVQEFDKHCPSPNTSTVHVSYLDSVNYFRPSNARTPVYQEVIIQYLHWTQTCGFKQAHIWSCPPQRGDNFIFNVHPKHQKTPAKDRLNSWYKTIFSRLSKLGIISDYSNFWDKYSSNFEFTPAVKSTLEENFKNSYKFLDDDSCWVPICPPIFENDLWVQEILKLSKSQESLLKKCFGNNKITNHKKCTNILVRVMKQSGRDFHQPVDAKALNLPLYHVIIKSPMDLGTINQKLLSRKYACILDFAMVFCLILFFLHIRSF